MVKKYETWTPEQYAKMKATMAARRQHSHGCPVCKKSFNCVGERCKQVNGVSHLACNNNRWSRYTKEVG